MRVWLDSSSSLSRSSLAVETFDGRRPLCASSIPFRALISPAQVLPFICNPSEHQAPSTTQCRLIRDALTHSDESCVGDWIFTNPLAAGRVTDAPTGATACKRKCQQDSVGSASLTPHAQCCRRLWWPPAAASKSRCRRPARPEVESKVTTTQIKQVCPPLCPRQVRPTFEARCQAPRQCTTKSLFPDEHLR